MLFISFFVYFGHIVLFYHEHLNPFKKGRLLLAPFRIKMVLVQFPEFLSRALCARLCVEREKTSIFVFNEFIILVAEVGTLLNN